MLALFAGGGRLPIVLVEQLLAQKTPFRVFEFVDNPYENPDGLPITRIQIEHIGSVIDGLVTDGIDQVCLAGYVGRPPLLLDQNDATSAPSVELLQKAFSSPDDVAIRLIISLFTRRGIRIVAAQDIAPFLVLDAGVFTQTKPQAHHLVSAAFGWQVLAEQGKYDNGQASVIADGAVVAQETPAGTDAMLTQLSEAKNAILFKGPKPDQDRRVDWPTIGLKTVESAVAAGLDGIVIQAHGVIVLDQQAVISDCDKAGIFLSALDRP